MVIYRNAECLMSYENAVNCMNALNAINGVEANVKTGGLGIRIEDESILQDVILTVKKFGGVLTTGLTELQERIIYPYPTK